jgi:hypothetical protein
MDAQIIGAIADLSGADALPSDTGTLQTVFPGTNKRTGWDVTFAGPGHPKTIALNQETSRKELHKSEQIERARVNGRKWKGDDKTPDEQRREFIEGLVARIVCWTPVNFGEGPVEFAEGDATAPKRAIELLLKPKLGAYVAQFVDYLIDERAFMKDSANN